MSESIVVLGYGPETPTPAESTFPAIAAENRPIHELTASMLNQRFAELPPEINWAIISDSTTSIGPQQEKALQICD